MYWLGLKNHCTKNAHYQRNTHFNAKLSVTDIISAFHDSNIMAGLRVFVYLHAWYWECMVVFTGRGNVVPYGFIQDFLVGGGGE